MKRGINYLLLGAFLVVLTCVTGCGGGGGGGSGPSGSGGASTSQMASNGAQVPTGNASADVEGRGNTYDTPEPGTLCVLVVGIAGVGSYVVYRRRRSS